MKGVSVSDFTAWSYQFCSCSIVIGWGSKASVRSVPESLIQR